MDGDRVPAISPDPALRRLDRLAGVWAMEGRVLGAADRPITGRFTFEWLPGGHFMKQHVRMDFAGLADIDSTEIIGYDPDTGSFPSTVYSNQSPQALPYTWRVDGDDLTITVDYGPLDATFRGRFTDDGAGFAGSWRPNPDADDAVNLAYDLAGRRVD